MSQLGGERAFRIRPRKDRSPPHGRRSISSENRVTVRRRRSTQSGNENPVVEQPRGRSKQLSRVVFR